MRKTTRCNSLFKIHHDLVSDLDTQPSAETKAELTLSYAVELAEPGYEVTRCGGCWTVVPPDRMVVVQEAIGRAYRCHLCLPPMVRFDREYLADPQRTAHSVDLVSLQSEAGQGPQRSE